MNIDKEILKEIKDIANKYSSIEKVVLFGSRAREDNYEKSDIDLAIYSKKDVDLFCDSIIDFIEDIENNTTTLLEFDFSDMNSIKDKLFIEQVENEGITIYEK